MNKSKLDMKKLVGTAALLAMSANAYSLTAILEISGGVTHYSGPQEFADTVGVIGFPFRAEIVVPDFQDFNPNGWQNNYHGKTSINFDGSMGAGMLLESDGHILWEGKWNAIPNPDYDSTATTCAPWTDPACDPAQNLSDYWVMDAAYGGLLGEATLDFDDAGNPVSFSYTVDRSWLSTFDPFIQEPELQGFGLSELTLTATGFSLVEPVNGPGWGLDAGPVIHYTADGYTASVTVVPLPAALPLFLGALAGLGVMGRRRTRA